MKYLLTLLCGIALTVLSQAQQKSEIQKAEIHLQKYHDLYFSFSVKKQADLLKLPSFISIDKVNGNTVYAYIYQSDFNKLLKQKINFTVLEKQTRGTIQMATDTSEMANWDRYPTYSVYVQMMQSYAEKYPSLTKLDTIGYSQNGHLILALKITDHPDIDEDEPEVFYTGQMHGDEVVDYAMFLRLIDYLLTNYGTNDTVDSLVNNIELWINPLSNPDGAYIGGDDDVSGAMRYLANGIDPNRNFPGPTASTGDSHPDRNDWAKETVLMMKFAEKHHFVLSVNSHSGAEVANYPWDSWQTSTLKTADDDWWRMVAKEYADYAQGDSPSNYFTDVVSSGYTEGGDWYIVYGGRQDYMNYYRHCREMTLELSSEKLLSSDELPAHWTYNRRAFLSYMKESLFGIRGIITDACTGKPIEAKVEILNHDTMNSFVYSAMPLGDYHRPIYAGTYTMKISAPGYQSKTIPNITVSNYQTIVENIQLEPESPFPDFEIMGNPSCNGEIRFVNKTQMSDTLASYHWVFGDGQTDTAENTSHVYNILHDTVYNVTLSVNNKCSGIADTTKQVFINLSEKPEIDDQSRCGSGQVLLTNADTTKTIYWYNEQDSLLAVGDTFLTPYLDADASFLARSIKDDTVLNIGDTSLSSNGNFLSEKRMHFLRFNVYRSTVLYSVKVNAATAGKREIMLRNAEGMLYEDTIIDIPQGVSEITLNFNLPRENNLELVASVFADLYETESNLSYPYTIGDLLSIKTSDRGTSQYFYFYDWKVLFPKCISAYDTVVAHIDTTRPNAAFETTLTGDTLYCKNRSSLAHSYQWFFGDGDSSEYVNPIHEYADTGEYLIMLIAKNACYQDTVLQHVFITGQLDILSLNKAWSVYPNPFTTESLTFYTSEKFTGNILIYNTLGELIFADYRHSFSKGSNKINLPMLKDGIFLLEIINLNTVDYKRKTFVIQKK